MGEDTKSVNWKIFGLSCVTRLLFWGTTIYIIYLCFRNGYSLTTVHVLSCTIGCTLLMIEATLAISGEALLAIVFSKRARIGVHWMAHFLGLALVVIGVGAIIYERISNDEYDSRSGHRLHGRLGRVTAIYAVVVGIAAVPLLFKKLVPRAMSFGSFKRTHIYLGFVALILLWAAQITGFYTSWWTASELGTNLALSAYVIGGFCLLAKPCYATLRKSFQ